MLKEELKIVGFAAVVCVVCSLLLSATDSALREKQAINVEVDRKLNVLKAFGVEIIDKQGQKLGKEEVDQFFTDHITEILLDKETGDILPGLDSSDLLKEELKAKTVLDKTKLPLYLWKDGDEVRKYAFPTSGYGLWSYLYGYLALDKDLATIVGITFYKHGETPGLGGEVDAKWFQNQFKGKKVFKDGELLTFEVVKGAVEGKYPEGNDHAVSGITGATITGKGLDTFINRDLQFYNRYFEKVRGS